MKKIFLFLVIFAACTKQQSLDCDQPAKCIIQNYAYIVCDDSLTIRWDDPFSVETNICDTAQIHMMVEQDFSRMKSMISLSNNKKTQLPAFKCRCYNE